MFSQACVIPSVHGGGACVAEGVCVWQGGVRAGETATEAGGMRPTGMHSC